MNASAHRTTIGLGITRAGFALTTLVLAVALMLSSYGTSSAWGQVRGRQTVALGGIPSNFYFAAFNLLDNGEYEEALETFDSELHGALVVGLSRWIDSICYHTMVGETLYRMGRNEEAVGHFDKALEMYVAYSDWMIRVTFNPVIAQASIGRQQRPVTWGRSKSNLKLGVFAESYPFRVGSLRQLQQAVTRGGAVVQPTDLMINAKEIVRCTCLAIRRRMELMGPAAQPDALNESVRSALMGRPGPPNHWTRAWIDVQLGLANAATGRDVQAIATLERGVIAGGEFEHPLTATALFVLGQLALKRGDYGEAARLFEETTYSAANFYDPALLEEAFRYGLMTHMISNQQGIYPFLEPAGAWARRERLDHLFASLQLGMAENLTALGQTKAALTQLDQVGRFVGRTDLPLSRSGSLWGSRWSYTLAQTRFQQGNVPSGMAALGDAVRFQQEGRDGRGASRWLYQIRLINSLVAKGSVTGRQAMDLYEQVLREPTAFDWTTNPLESLTSLVTPHEAAFQNWFDVALSRNIDSERALEIADLARRHRFLSSLELGGRLLNLRWVLEGPAEMHSEQARLERQGLSVKFPAYEQLALQARNFQKDLRAMPLAPETPDEQRAYTQKLNELTKVSEQQETVLHAMALRRAPSQMVFPPVRSYTELKQSLPENGALLAFYETPQAMYAFLMTRDGYGSWKIGSPTTLKKEMMQFLRAMGNYDKNRAITADELTETDWQEHGAAVLAEIMRGSDITLPHTFEELLIVPDGLLWYLPFEALPVADGDKTVPLLTKLRIRYSPTVGLGIKDLRPRIRGGNTAVVVGSLFPRDDLAIAEAAFDELGRTVPGAAPVRAPVPTGSGVYASLFNRLVVLADVNPPDGSAYGLQPLGIERRTPGSSLEQWMRLPWGGPELIVLPGFHTAAEDAMKSQSTTNAGNEMFFTACGLMSTGARTVLLSRWRVGGQTTFDLVREFAQEAPHTTAADAWQRSVFLALAQPLNPDAEPRFKAAVKGDPPLAEHPFFWANYLLIDTGSAPSSDDAIPPGDPRIGPAAAAFAPPR